MKGSSIVIETLGKALKSSNEKLTVESPITVKIISSSAGAGIANPPYGLPSSLGTSVEFVAVLLAHPVRVKKNKKIKIIYLNLITLSPPII
jgi:hypothetical protein